MLGSSLGPRCFFPHSTGAVVEERHVATLISIPGCAPSGLRCRPCVSCGCVCRGCRAATWDLVLVLLWLPAGAVPAPLSLAWCMLLSAPYRGNEGVVEGWGTAHVQPQQPRKGRKDPTVCAVMQRPGGHHGMVASLPWSPVLLCSQRCFLKGRDTPPFSVCPLRPVRHTARKPEEGAGALCSGPAARRGTGQAVVGFWGSTSEQVCVQMHPRAEVRVTPMVPGRLCCWSPFHPLLPHSPGRSQCLVWLSVWL